MVQNNEECGDDLMVTAVCRRDSLSESNDMGSQCHVLRKASFHNANNGSNSNMLGGAAQS